MLVVEIVLAAVVVFAVAAVTMGKGGSIVNFTPDWPGRGLPEGRAVRADDVANVRFSLAFRGYRMSEVDTALDRFAHEIAQRDARIEQLTGRPFEASELPYTPQPLGAEATRTAEPGALTHAAEPGALPHAAEPGALPPDADVPDSTVSSGDADLAAAGGEPAEQPTQVWQPPRNDHSDHGV